MVMESANDRQCLKCKQLFSPYSMAPSRERAVPPSVGYVCITCRTFKEKP